MKRGLFILVSTFLLMAQGPNTVRTFPNITGTGGIVSLGAASAQYVNAFVSVQGHAAAGDGDTGVFMWSPSSTATADGGTIFAAAGVSTGRWLRALSPSPVLTPQMFGAKCDETTVDNTALQAMETAAGKAQGSVNFIGPKMCKATVALTPQPGVDHYCSIGMNGLDTGFTANHDCGVLEQGGLWAYDMPTNSGLGTVVQAPTWHDMQIDSAAGGIRVGNTTLGASQSVAQFLKIQRVNIGAAAGSQAVQATVCFYCEVDHDVSDGQVEFYMSDFAKVTNNSFQEQNNSDSNIPVLMLGDSTYSNGDVVDHNSIECISENVTACIKSNADDITITNNTIECTGSNSLPTVIDLSAPASEGGFSNKIDNNKIMCPSSDAVSWLTVENTQYLYSLSVTNNICAGCALGTPSFNGGNGMPQYVPSTTFLSQIFHSGNSNDSGFPFSSFTNIPAPQGQQTPGLLLALSPGGFPYTVDRTNAGATVMVNGGAWVLASGSKELDWIGAVPTLTGTVDMCFLASSASSTSAPTFTALDNGSSLGTSNPTLTTAKSWNCVSNVSVTTQAGEKIVSAASGVSINIYEVIIRQHGI